MPAPHLRILKVGVSLDHDASLRFVSLIALRTCWATVQTQNNTRSVPASSALTWSCTEAIMHIPQIVTYTAVEKIVVCKGEQK